MSKEMLTFGNIEIDKKKKKKKKYRHKTPIFWGR